jgi:hypothetical protein
MAHVSISGISLDAFVANPPNIAPQAFLRAATDASP